MAPSGLRYFQRDDHLLPSEAPKRIVDDLGARIDWPMLADPGLMQPACAAEISKGSDRLHATRSSPSMRLVHNGGLRYRADRGFMGLLTLTPAPIHAAKQ